MKIAAYKGARWSKASRDDAKAASTAAKAEATEMRAKIDTLAADVGKLKKGK